MDQEIEKIEKLELFYFSQSLFTVSGLVCLKRWGILYSKTLCAKCLQFITLLKKKHHIRSGVLLIVFSCSLLNKFWFLIKGIMMVNDKC